MAMIATQSNNAASSPSHLDPGNNSTSLSQLKEFDFAELDVIKNIESPNNKAAVIKSSRHLNGRRSPQYDGTRKETTLSQLQTTALVAPKPTEIGAALGSKQYSKMTFRPSWPDDEPRLPGTNLSLARRLDPAVKAANVLPKRGSLVRRDTFIPRRKNSIHKDRVFMKVGNKFEPAHSDESDDDLRPLQEQPTTKLRKRFSFLSQRQNGEEVPNIRLGRHNSRRLSRYLITQGLHSSIPDVQKGAEDDEQTKREIRADIRKKFRAAGFMAIFSARLAMAYVRTTTENDISPFVKQIKFKDEETKLDLLDDSPYSFDPARFKANRDMRISEETRRILCKPPWTRTPREVYHVEVLLRDIKAYADYPVGMQRKIAEVGQYRKYNAKRVIVREGHVANNFYFILSGSVVVTVMDEHRKYAKPVAYLHRGDSFGELAIIHNKRRQSTVVAKEKVEMLAIWFEDYLDIFMAGGVKNIYDPDHNSFITSVSILRDWPLKLLEENESKFVFHFYNFTRRGKGLLASEMDVANTACPVGTTKDDLDRNSTRLSRLLSTVKESFVPVEADVEGSIPEWLEGELVRVGPGMFEINGHKLNHLLDGMSILHKFSINNGRVTYQSNGDLVATWEFFQGRQTLRSHCRQTKRCLETNHVYRYLRGDNFKSNMAKQRIVVSEFGTVAAPDPCDSIFKRFVAKFHLPKPGDNCNVNILPFQNDECYAVTETQFLRKFDPNSLDAQEKIDLKELVSVNLATAHPHFDVDGTMYNIGSAFSGKPTYCVIKVPPTSKPENGESASAFNQASVLAKVPGQFKAYPCYMHSFAMTQNFIVLMEQPFYMNVLKMLKNQLLGFPAVDCFEFSNEYKTKIHVVRKCTGEVLEQQYTSPAQIVLHHINAYEDGNHVVMDFIDIEDASVFGNATLDEFRRTGGDVMRGVAKRLVFPVTIPQDARAGENLVSLKTSASAILQEDGSVHCESETLSRNFDLPTINMKYSGKKYRFFYATGMFSPGEFENTVVKCDTETKQLKTWKVSPTQYYSEPIFVPSPLAEEEDDGVVLCGVSDVSPDTPDYLVVLDGKSFTELGRATIPDKLRVPYGLHGQFLSP